MAKAKKVNMYQIVDKHTSKVVEEGFAKREDAKPRRNELNKESGHNDPDHPRYIVSRGEAHPNGPSNGVSTRQRGKNDYL